MNLWKERNGELIEHLVEEAREIIHELGLDIVKPTKAQTRKKVKKILAKEYGSDTEKYPVYGPGGVLTKADGKEEPGYRYQELACMVFVTIVFTNSPE